MRWNPVKSKTLKKTRGLSFEDLIQCKFVGALKHPTKEHQQILLFEHKNYLWVAPCVVTNEDIFLKTLFPSRKYTKLWKDGKLK